ncbi:hypothetical protein TorRG33x02_199200 [Trema orientale]|uniref:Uncharacterized protein n=1 Tax=Trema orientale TaxID=63057 RepID=A0A2P5EFH3_TREOI|nr:hypothetical protein TorRG33x02_199200 [Trema orientale]
MDPVEIARLCERLNLDNQDGLVMKMNTSIIEDGKEKMELCLVGRVFGNKIDNREGLGDMAEQGSEWSPLGILRRFLFGFHFRMFLLLVEAKTVLGIGAELIGKVLDIDAEGPMLRARIVINVTVPLCRGLRVFIDNVTGPISIPAFNLKQWRKARRERKGGPYWSNSSSSFGKSSANNGGGGDSDGGYEAVQLLRENQETDFQKPVGGANSGKSLIESPGLDLEIGLQEGSFHGLESRLEDTDVGIQKTSILPKSIDVDGAVPELSSTVGRSFSRSGSISKKGKGKSYEETAAVEENSSDSMPKKVENLIFNYGDNVELIKDPMQINKDSNMNSNIILNDNSNVYPINMVMEQDIPICSLLVGSESINEGNHVRKACTWKRKIRVSPKKSKSKKKSGKSPPKHVTTSPFMKSLMQTSPRYDKLKKSPSSKISHQTSLKPSSSNAKRKLVDYLGGSETLTKRGRCIATASGIPDENISASPDVQDRRLG